MHTKRCCICNTKIEEHEKVFLIPSKETKDYSPENLPNKLEHRQGLNVIWELHH